MGENRTRKRGFFITLEGIEGCGKSTQAKRLAAHLRSDGYRIVETREPGGTPFAECIRALLLDSASEPIAPECEAHLICASRSQHVARIIRPALRKGAVVLCDRFSDSTMAYQGYGRQLDLKNLETLNRIATGTVAPDLTLLLDLPVSIGLARRRRERYRNRLDREPRGFYERVRNGYLQLAARHPRRIKIIDANPDPEAVEEEIARVVKGFLTKRRIS